MNLTTLLHNAIATANTLTESLQPNVTHAAFDGTYSDSGEPNYGAAAARTAIVEQKQQLVSGLDGSEHTSSTKLTFVAPVVVNVLDRITLPDGSTPRILAIGAPLDNAGLPFITEVWF